MCGRYVLTATSDELAAYFGVDHVVGSLDQASFNVAPSQFVPAVAAERDGTTRRLDVFRWGLIPFWADDPSIGNRTINARSETLATSRAYRDAFSSRRCLIPVDGFYEWQRPEGSTRRPRTPWYFHSQVDKILALGGLWERWRDPLGNWLLSCTVITTAANGLMAPVHDRMPVVVRPEHFETWLARRPLEEAERQQLLAPSPEETLTGYVVGSGVSNPRNDGPELIAPAPAPETVTVERMFD